MFHIAFGRVISVVLLLLTMKVLTTLLPPNEVGRVYLVTSLIAFFSAVFVGPAGMYMNRHLHVWNDDGTVQYFFKFFIEY